MCVVTRIQNKIITMKINSKLFENIVTLKYLGMAVTHQKHVNVLIKVRLSSPNVWPEYFDLQLPYLKFKDYSNRV